MLTEKEATINFIQDTRRKLYGAWFLGHFLYFNYSLKKSLAALKLLKNYAEYLGNFLIRLLIFVGWLSFIFWLYLSRDVLSTNPITILFFWRDFNPLILFFILSLWLDLFLVYRNSAKRAAAKKINYRLFLTDNQKLFPKKKKSEGKRYNVAAACSESVLSLIEEAYFLAEKLGQKQATVIHLFRTLLRDKEIQNIFIRLNVDAKKLISLLDRNLLPEVETSAGPLSPQLHEILLLAFVDAYDQNQKSLDALNIISYCYERSQTLAEILDELEIDADKIKNVVAWFRISRQLAQRQKAFRSSAMLKPGSNMNRSYTAIATPTLDKFSHDLTIEAKYGSSDLCVSREKEIEEIFQSLASGHNGLLLVGSTGVGKSAIINGLAQLMVAEQVPKFLKDRRLIELDVPLLVSGVDASQVQERLLICIQEANRSGNIVLYIDNVNNLIGISSGSRESLDLSEVLAGAIRRKHIYCLATVAFKNYSSSIEGRPLGEAMTAIGIDEPNKNEAIRILESKVGSLEAKYGIYVVYGALEAAVDMSARYLHDQFLPLKAIDLLEKGAIIANSNAANDPESIFCGREEVAAAISELTGVPTSKISKSESQKLLGLEEEIHHRLIGQEEAVAAVAASLRRARAELKDSKRPIASFLFLGPTGVGKTELAKAVSEVYFGDEDYLVRLDMSEYQEADSVDKMIGNVNGTPGYLTEAVRKKPFSLVLLDEIEKAHPDILNLFLQLFDDGRLTDGQGRTISFTESIIIATSNIGALYIQEQIKAGTDISIIKQGIIEEQLNKYMRPELINRFDGIIVFKPLSEADVFAVAALMLQKIKKSLADKGLNFKADKNGVAVLARAGYDPKFGARPLRRLLQDRIENVIANKILSGELKRRDTVVINSQAKIEIEKGLKL
jgi:ATP-dependent Clp protease ATP-binding subunit ClpC